MTTVIDRKQTALGAVARAGARPVARLKVSFEFSPPKDEVAEEKLWSAIRRLEPLSPQFVSVTYGAGGSTRERTHRTVLRILNDTSLRPAAHLTCVSATRAEVDQVIQDYHAAGVRHIVALRGDPPGSLGGAYVPGPDSYANATELTAAIKRIAPDMEVSVGLYPQVHPESPSVEHDIDVLKAKVDAGASRAITQFFFDLDAYLRFMDKVRAAGVTIPVSPGIMPVTNLAALQRMAGPCGIQLPDWLENLFSGLEDDVETRRLIATAISAEMCAKLEEEGYGDCHFYTLNRPELTYAICRVLGVREQAGL